VKVPSHEHLNDRLALLFRLAYIFEPNSPSTAGFKEHSAKD
jgi:hypothetical protein